MLRLSPAFSFFAAASFWGCQKPPAFTASPVQRLSQVEDGASGAKTSPPSTSPAFARSSPKKRIPAEPIAWTPLPGRDQTISRIAFGSCSSQYREQVIWPHIASKNPDIFLHLGDMIYADMLPYNSQMLPAHVSVVEKARIDYALLSAQSSFRSFSAAIPMLHIWDDHDYGRNDAGGDLPFKEDMAELFLEFVGAGPDDPRRGRPGIYDAHTFGSVGHRTQIILLDTRFFRSPLLRDERTPEEKQALGIVGTYAPNPDPAATLLGEDQWMWLGRQLREPAELRLIVSSIQIVAGEKGVESWGTFPLERARLYDLITSTRAKGVVFLSGDVHFAEISRSDAGPYPLYDFTSSNLAQAATHWGRDFKNTYRVLGTLDEENFGLVEVDWAQEAPLVHLRAIDGEGNEAFTLAVPLSELSF
jgi:alkaline phosphatase D